MGLKKTTTSLLFVFLLIQATFSHAHCVHTIAGFAGKNLMTPLFHVMKGIFYPYFFTYKLGQFSYLYSTRKSAEAWDYVKKNYHSDKYHTVGWGATGFLYVTTGISFNQFESLTDDFYTDEDKSEEKLMVIIDAFVEDDWAYAGVGTYLYNMRYKDNKNVVLINNVKNSQDIENQMRHIIRTRGKPALVDFFDHATPGSPEKKLNWISGQLKNGAKIRYTSCYVMNGEGGIDFTQEVKKRLDGLRATLYGSQVQMLPNILELASFKLGLPEPPKTLRNIAEPYSTFFSVITLYTLMEQKIFKDKDVHGPFVFQSRVKKVDIHEEIYDSLGRQDSQNSREFLENYYVKSTQLAMILFVAKQVKDAQETIKTTEHESNTKFSPKQRQNIIRSRIHPTDNKKQEWSHYTKGCHLTQHAPFEEITGIDYHPYSFYKNLSALALKYTSHQEVVEMFTSKEATYSIDELKKHFYFVKSQAKPLFDKLAKKAIQEIEQGYLNGYISEKRRDREIKSIHKTKGLYIQALECSAKRACFELLDY